LDSGKLLQYITSAKVGDGNWKGTAQSFILHWQDQVRLYDKIVEPSERLSDTTKKDMLETAVHPIDMLRAVKVQADQLKVTNGHSLDYVKYSRLLISAATNYDSAYLNCKSKSVASGCRNAYTHDIIHDTVDDYYADIDDDYGIDIGIDTIQANVNKMQSNCSSTGSSNLIAFNQWKQMSKEAQGIWETIPESDKDIILKASKPSSQMRSSPSGNSNAPQRSVYVHEMEHVEDDADPFDALVDAAADDDDSGGTTLLAHVTKQKSLAKPSGSNISPSNICKVLSTNKGNDGSKPTPSEFNVNGKINHLVNHTHIVYRVTASPNQGASLIDRGAKGSFAGDDVHNISKTLRLTNRRLEQTTWALTRWAINYHTNATRGQA
jgi:hypothetical protein